MNNVNIRELSIKILRDIDKKSVKSKEAFEIHTKDYNIESKDKALLTELVYGVLRKLETIDYIISKHSKIKLKKISPWIINILRIGVYQIVFLKKIPDSAAVNESVKLASKFGHQSSKGFVNAILRAITKLDGVDKLINAIEDDVERSSVKYSFPFWLTNRWSKKYDKEFLISLMESLNKESKIVIRTNTLKVSKSELIKELEFIGYSVREGMYIDEAIIVDNPAGLLKTKLYRDGLFLLQDESSMFVTKVLNPKKGDKILDVCSAPGGKISHVAQVVCNQAQIIARDVSDFKVRNLKDTFLKLGINCIESEVYDATILDEDSLGYYDKVIVDAPCSGLGIIRRKPDIKWNRTESDIKGLANIQRDILKNASRYVKKGGYLLYSTCTFEDEENIVRVNEFLEENKEFSLVDFNEELPEKLNFRCETKGFMQLFPNLHDVDGFFIAKFIRK